MTEQPSWWQQDDSEPPESPLIDTTTPHIARVYDYCLGGKNNFEVDRRAAEEFVKVMPGILPTVRESRAFLSRAVQFLAQDCGIRQFLDIGTGLPTADNTHQVAQRIAPQCRIVYADNDPMVLAHARALLTSSPEGACSYLDADLRDFRKILSVAAQTLDLSKPLAVMLIGVLHCIPDQDEPFAIVSELMDAVPAGSYLVFGHPASDVEAKEAATATAGLNRSLAAPVTFRTHEQIARFLAGLEVLDPGLVQYPQWRPAPDAGPAATVSAWCAVARKP